ncbi:MAG: alkaline phosphatase family protein [Acidaminococcaceae bacterium]|nr:alkaline phosphatase family protein [Acidaminococcaceae bacterium]
MKNLTALIIGADALKPEYIFGHPYRYPNLSRLVEYGASGTFSAYVQKGYHGSYVSEMNWPSIYTGLHPWEHGFSCWDNHGNRIMPSMKQFQGLTPFWEICNKAGLKVGLWAADCCEYPTEIDGYAVSAYYKMLETPDEIRTRSRTLQVAEKDQKILNLIQGKVPPRLYPKTLEQQGYTYEELLQNPKLAWKAVEEYHFEDVLDNFADELDFFTKAMFVTQKKYPVDVLHFFTPTTDLAAHFSMYCDDADVLVRTYQLLDDYLGRWIEEFRPENVIVTSDHGMINFKEQVSCADEDIRREAFSARDQVIWLPNGYIAFQGENGALLFTSHALKGTFIIAGKGIRHTHVKQMRTLDIYPTMLEMIGLEIPQGKSGFVQDVFDRPLINSDRSFPAEVSYRTAAVLQCYAPNLTDIVLNEIYIRNRFTRLTVVGEEKYREIFLNNPRVSGFLPYSAFRPNEFDEVYVGVYNETTGLTRHVRVH